MSRKLTLAAALALVICVIASPAQADPLPVADDTLALSLGARIGGYGFREVAEGATAWNDCRMDGGGVFGQLDLGKHFYSELAFDFYQAHADVVSSGMERLSFHSQASAGLRMFPEFWVVPTLHVGAGAEWTKVEMLESGAEMEDIFPVAFMGLGGELNLLDDLRVGAHVRMMVMSLPLHGEGGTHAHGVGSAYSHVQQGLREDAAIPTSYEAAGQAQFFIRYLL